MKHSYLIYIVSLIFAACQTKTETMQNLTSLTHDLDSILQQRFRDDEPGACVIVKQGDSLIYNRCFGYAILPGHENEEGVRITPDTKFNICSVSKQFSALALLKLEEMGLISLQDPVKKYFPKFQAPFFDHITLANLLSHTSGLPDSRPRTQAEWERYTALHDTQFKTVEDFKRFCKVEESVRYMETLDSLAFEPGSQYEYQNPTFQLAELIIEQVTGTDFDTWMKENIFIPAGMTETVYFEPEREIKNMAHGYQPVGFTTLNGDNVPAENPFDYWRDKNQKWEENDYGEASFYGTKADGGIYTSPMEFLKYDEALYHDKIVSKTSREKAHTAYILTDIDYTDYGYGFFLEHNPNRSNKIYHTGDNGGFLIFEGRIPEKDIFYLVFANRPDWEREITIEAIDQVLMKYIP